VINDEEAPSVDHAVQPARWIEKDAAGEHRDPVLERFFATVSIALRS